MSIHRRATDCGHLFPGHVLPPMQKKRPHLGHTGSPSDKTVSLPEVVFGLARTVSVAALVPFWTKLIVGCMLIDVIVDGVDR